MALEASKNGREVFDETLRNGFRKYPDRKDGRYREEQLFPTFRPTFGIASGSSVFTIGSCFARNVEDVLIAAGVNVPTAVFAAPADEAPGRPNRVLNQYNPGTMLQCVQSVKKGVPTGGYFDVGPDARVDALLATGSRAVTRMRAAERRAQIVDLYRDGLAASNTVVITLGLIEAWYDNDASLYLNEAPSRAVLNANPKRFSFRRINLNECLRITSEMIELLSADRQRNILVTVSPVPLQVTFSGGDAVTANTYSKSVLRVVSEEISQNFPNVDYFPSYEAVSTMGLRALGEDNVHVRPVVVDRVVQHMLKHYHAPN